VLGCLVDDASNQIETVDSAGECERGLSSIFSR
jgi:hypothetical protein